MPIVQMEKQRGGDPARIQSQWVGARAHELNPILSLGLESAPTGPFRGPVPGAQLNGFHKLKTFQRSGLKLSDMELR